MDITTYTTRQDAFDYAIEPALGEYVADYDMDAIFDTCFAYNQARQGFEQIVDVDGFWASVERHAL